MLLPGDVTPGRGYHCTEIQLIPTPCSKPQLRIVTTFPKPSEMSEGWNERDQYYSSKPQGRCRPQLYGSKEAEKCGWAWKL
jgi:hypothetical protein